VIYSYHVMVTDVDFPNLKLDKRTELNILVHDARRFFLKHRRMIEIAPLQV